MDTVAPVGSGSRRSSTPWRASSASALEWSSIGALAGVLLGALDYGRLALSKWRFELSWDEHLAHFTLLFLAGYVAGLLGSLLLGGAVHVGRWMALRWPVSARAAISWVIATACLPVIVPVAIALFRGRGIRQTAIAAWGPFVVTALAWVLCAAAVWAVQKLQASLEGPSGTPRRRAAAAIAAALAVAPLLYCDLYLFPGLYEYLHAVLMALVFVVILLGVYLLRYGWRAPVAIGASAVAVLSLPLFVYSSTRYDASLADFGAHFAYTKRVILLARHATDLDRDGYSHILGHHDPDILNPRIRPLAVDVPDNGVDEDGVFGDLSQAELAAASQKYARGRAPQARARYRALSTAAPLPNLLLITIDTLRADRILGAGGGDGPPPLADFQRDSVRFERAFASSSYTQSSVTMMMTGRYTPPETSASLFQVLRAAGCTTLLAFAQTPFKILNESRPDVVASFDRQAVVPDREPGDLAAFHSYAATRPTSQAIVAAALRQLEEQRQARTCSWVYLFDVHQWQQLSDPEVVGDTTVRGPDRYDRAVAYTLKQVSHLLEGLTRLGLADRTIVALSGDHGEALGDKGFVGHTRYVYNSLLHVPLVIRAPRLEPRAVRETEVGLIDLAPTLLDLMDSGPTLDGLDGTSLLPLMFGQTLDHLVFAREADYQAVFDANYKLVIDRPEGRYRLYDLGADEAEERSLFGLPRYDPIARDLYYAYQASAIGPNPASAITGQHASIGQGE